MTIREYSKGHKVEDEVSAVLKSPFYAQNSAPKALRDAILGPHSTKLVTISRHYFKCDPEVVVDFQPSPLEGKFYVDEKRIYFMERGIVYVPVFLGESLSKEQFAARVKESETLMRLGRQEIRENGALRQVDIEELLTAPDVVQVIDQEVMRRVKLRQAELKGNLRGVAMVRALAKIKREVVDELRRKAKDGRTGQIFSSEQLVQLAR